jgi:hypothetical protein
MLSTYFNITSIAEWCAFICALILLNKQTSIWRLFIPFLFITIVTETIGWYFNYVVKHFNNTLPFNILMIIGIVFFAYLFSLAKPMQHVKKKIFYLIILFILSAVFNLFFIQKQWTYNSYTETFGDIILSAICCYFLFTILKNDEYINLFHYEYFWLANGLLFSCLGSVLIYIFSDSLYAYYKQTKIPVYDYINYVLNVVLYASLIIAFICRHKTTRSLQVSL